jgi:hypothetical protein
LPVPFSIPPLNHDKRGKVDNNKEANGDSDSYNAVAAGVTSKPVAAAGLADGESSDRGAELRTAGTNGLLARLEGHVFDDRGRAGHGGGGGQERAEESGGNGELHFDFGGFVGWKV